MKHILDLRGMISPFTILKFSNGFRKIGIGDILEIIGTNPNTRKDILEVLTGLPCEVLCVCKEEDRYLIRLRKLGAGKTQKGGKKKDQRHIQAIAP